MTHTESDQVTDFTRMGRDQIRAYLTEAIGDAELPEEVRESLVRNLEDLDAVSTDLFWVLVERTFTAHEAEEVAENIKATYRLAGPATATAEWVPLRRVRAELEGNRTREAIDAALKDLFINGVIQLIPEVNRIALTHEDHEAAIHVGGVDRHLMRWLC